MVLGTNRLTFAYEALLIGAHNTVAGSEKYPIGGERSEQSVSALPVPCVDDDMRMLPTTRALGLGCGSCNSYFSDSPASIPVH
jgi:hypothetical protein